MTLNVKAIGAAKPGDVLYDEAVRGLHLRCFPNRKTWYLYFRTKAGTERRPKLGDLKEGERGVLGLTEAREAARQMLALVAQGQDPIAERTAAKGVLTVAALMDRYLEARSAGKTIEQARWANAKYIVPRFGPRKATELHPDDVEAFHRALTQRGATLANRVLEYLMAAYRLAEKRRWLPVGTNPCGFVQRNAQRSRKRHLKAEEFPRLAAALDRHAAYNPEGAAYLWALLYSGARPMEIAGARPEWLEVRPDGIGVLRLPDGKTGARDVYLPPQVVALLARLPASRKTLTGLRVPPRYLWEQIVAEAKLDGLWMRDLRRSFASVGLASGQSASLIGELLGHKSIQTTKVYARLMDDAAQVAVVQTANVIDRLIRAPAAEQEREAATPPV
jgi:integrase